MADTCMGYRKCNTYYPGWLTGGHPTAAEGIVNRKVCYRDGDCCGRSSYVRNCGAFYVYSLTADGRYCSRFCGA